MRAHGFDTQTLTTTTSTSETIGTSTTLYLNNQSTNSIYFDAEL